MQIFIRTLNHTVTLDVEPTNTIKTVQEMTGYISEDFRLLYGGKTLEEHKTLEDYSISKEATLDLVLRLSGGQNFPFTIGVPLVDITNKSGAKDFNSCANSPTWRQAYPGLCLEGKCTNIECKAYGSDVIINKGKGTYDAIQDDDEETNKCPECGLYVKVERIAFNNCSYWYEGRLKEDKRRPTYVRSNPESVGHFYRVYAPEYCGIRYWLSLVIHSY